MAIIGPLLIGQLIKIAIDEYRNPDAPFKSWEGVRKATGYDQFDDDPVDISTLALPSAEDLGPIDLTKRYDWEAEMEAAFPNKAVLPEPNWPTGNFRSVEQQLQADVEEAKKIWDPFGAAEEGRTFYAEMQRWSRKGIPDSSRIHTQPVGSRR